MRKIQVIAENKVLEHIMGFRTQFVWPPDGQFVLLRIAFFGDNFRNKE
jgi:hypothetical protein